MGKLKVSLVVPIYNSETTLKSQLDQVIKILDATSLKYEIILCDDKSSDQTARILRKYIRGKKFIKLIIHDENQGIANTLWELYQKATLAYIALFSLDGDWNPEDIEKLITQAYLTKGDIIIGTRSKKDYTLYRKIVSFFYNFLPILFFGVKTFDAASIKIFKRSVFMSLPITSRGIFFEAEMIIRATKLGYRTLTYPVSYSKRVRSSGTAANLSNVIHSILDLIRLRLKII